MTSFIICVYTSFGTSFNIFVKKFLDIITMAVFDVFDPLRGITPRFTEEQLTEIIDWFDSTAKPLLTINDGEPINVISIENLIDFLNLKKYRIHNFVFIVYISLYS